jgi:hypothetical protein
MKYILLVLLFPVLLVAQQGDNYFWYETDAPYYNSSNGMTSDSSGNLYYITHGFLLKSTDDGFHWELLKDENDEFIRIGRVACDENGTLYLLGDSLLITKDEGKTFEKRRLPEFKYYLSDFITKNDTLAFVCNYQDLRTKIYISNDFGDSYKIIYDDTISISNLKTNVQKLLIFNVENYGTCKSYSLSNLINNKVLIDTSYYIDLLNDETLLFLNDKKIYSCSISGLEKVFINDLIPYVHRIHANNNCILATNMSKVVYSKDRGFTIDSIFGELVFMGPPSTEILAPNGRPYIGWVGNAKLLRWTKQSEVSVKQFENNIRISPNPATDYIELSASSVILSKAKNPDIYIFDLLGIEQSTPNLTPTLSEGEGAVRLDVSSLSPGVYFVRVGDVVRKFVKM